MRIKTSQQVRVGIFVTLGLILAMVVIFLLGDGFTLFEKQYSLKARFDEVSGLRVGAPVFLAGIQIGKVEQFEFPEKLDESQIIVVMKLNQQYQERIRQDSSASIVTQGLLGDKAIFITQGKATATELKDEDFIEVKEGPSLDTFAKKGGELVDKLNKLVANTDGIVSDIRTKESFLHALIYDIEGANLVKELSEVTRSAGDVMREVKTGRGMLHSLIYDPVRPGIGKVFSDAAENMRTLSKDLAVVGGRIERGEGSIGGLTKDPTVYYDLMTLLGKANRNKLLRTVIRATLATNEKDLSGGK